MTEAAEPPGSPMRTGGAWPTIPPDHDCSTLGSTLLLIRGFTFFI